MPPCRSPLAGSPGTSAAAGTAGKAAQVCHNLPDLIGTQPGVEWHGCVADVEKDLAVAPPRWNVPLTRDEALPLGEWHDWHEAL
jgi:hypothetical protein